jgi:hypothetical protein
MDYPKNKQFGIRVIQARDEDDDEEKEEEEANSS